MPLAQPSGRKIRYNPADTENRHEHADQRRRHAERSARRATTSARPARCRSLCSRSATLTARPAGLAATYQEWMSARTCAACGRLERPAQGWADCVVARCLPSVQPGLGHESVPNVPAASPPGRSTSQPLRCPPEDGLVRIDDRLPGCLSLSPLWPQSVLCSCRTGKIRPHRHDRWQLPDQPIVEA